VQGETKESAVSSRVPQTRPTGPPVQDDGGGEPAAVDRVVLGAGLALVLGFVVWGVADADGLAATAGDALALVTGSAGWLFILGTAGFAILVLALAFSRFGRIRLGRDADRPEFSTGAWFAMMFAAGMGIGLVFWGAAEPLSHFGAPPLGLAEPGTPEAARLGMQYTIFHWGLHPWALYALVGMALAYATFRKGRPNLVSSIVLPHQPVRSAARRAIDVFAIVLTVFGAATSLGLGAMQINSGLASAYGAPVGNGVAIAVIAGLTLLFVASAVSGVHRGIKYVSVATIGLAVLLGAFVFLAGPTLFILNTFTETLGDYIGQVIPMSFRSGPFGGAEWLSGWTLFYWAWWMSWAPFVGTFIARISRGRTIREFVVAVLLVPTLVSVVWFSIMGGAALGLELGGADLSTALADGGAEGSLFALLGEFPLLALTSTLVVVVITLFFVSSADSASMVLGMLSSGGSRSPARSLVVLWGALTALTGAVLLLAGGLSAMQTVGIVLAAPFILILVAVSVVLVRELREEPALSTLPRSVRAALREELDRSRAAAAPASGTAVPPAPPKAADDGQHVPPAQTRVG
jgi:glycine betaine transporter